MLICSPTPSSVLLITKVFQVNTLYSKDIAIIFCLTKELTIIGQLFSFWSIFLPVPSVVCRSCIYAYCPRYILLITIRYVVFVSIVCCVCEHRLLLEKEGSIIKWFRRVHLEDVFPKMCNCVYEVRFVKVFVLSLCFMHVMARELLYKAHKIHFLLCFMHVRIAWKYYLTHLKYTSIMKKIISSEISLLNILQSQ